MRVPKNTDKVLTFFSIFLGPTLFQKGKIIDFRENGHFSQIFDVEH